jgi:hypothetical protein
MKEFAERYYKNPPLSEGRHGGVEVKMFFKTSPPPPCKRGA